MTDDNLPVGYFIECPDGHTNAIPVIQYFPDIEEFICPGCNEQRQALQVKKLTDKITDSLQDVIDEIIQDCRVCCINGQACGQHGGTVAQLEQLKTEIKGNGGSSGE